MMRMVLIFAIMLSMFGCIHPRHLNKEKSVSLEKYRGIRVIVESDVAQDTIIDDQIIKY